MAYPYRQPYGPRDRAYSNINGGDSRGGLMRRFTTNALPSLSPIGQQRRQAAGEVQMPGLQNRVAPSERRIRHIERLLEQQRQINAELDKIDDETRREVEDGLRHERAVSDMIAQSEPTTPPEYHDGLQGTAATRPNRFSSASLTSPPPGIASRSNRSSTQLTSPPPGIIRPYTSGHATSIPSQSVPGSRRQSDDEEEADVLYYDPGLHRSAANPNRSSMPVTSYDRQRNVADLRSSLGALESRSFLFDDEEQPLALPSKQQTNKTTPPDTKTYLQVQHTADGFPKLIRREDNSELVAASSGALDLALTQTSNSEQQATDRPTATRHRISLPPSALNSNVTLAPLNGILAKSNDAKSAASIRRSLEVKFTAETKRPSLMATPPRGMPNGMGKGHSSYSTNDIPTLKSIDGEQSGGVPIGSPSTHSTAITDTISPDFTSLNLDRTISDNASMTTSSRQSQDFTGLGNFHQNHDALNGAQAGLPHHLPPLGASHSADATPLPPFPLPNMQYGQPPYYGNYGMQSLNNGFNNMNIGGGFGAQGAWPNQMPQFQQPAYAAYTQMPQGGQVVTGATRYTEANRNANPMQRRAEAEEMYSAISISDIKGQIYGLCKDQHGCRFLQKKLKEQNAEDVQLIFNEVKDHFQELMVDPFGNYLCQRLVEHCTDEQRTALVQNAAPAMTMIALNQHGTRALQRMIELISTPEQTNMLIEALRFDVVQLIQDLNGNHVMQKCLNHLSSQDAQFIFDAVGANCVAVGTHRHGCCVLQRCVDHASGSQKGAMVDAVIANAFALVQDPFGNYVVQYILDLSETCFTEPLCLSFLGNVAFLSKQKFSSNVMEKCIRCASPETRRHLILEITTPSEIERMLRDSFANYVVQTAMEFADDETKLIIIETLRPMLPNIRSTPYGRRIQSKIQDFDNGGLGAMSNINFTSIARPGSEGSSYQGTPGSGRTNRMGMVGAPPSWTNGNGLGAAAPGFGGALNGNHHFTNGSHPNGGQGYQGYPGYGGPPQPPFGHF